MCISDVITYYYPKAKHHSYWVHLARNVSLIMRVQHQLDILTELKKVYAKNTLETAQIALADFIEI